jgi:hypothetical protein
MSPVSKSAASVLAVIALAITAAGIIRLPGRADVEQVGTEFPVPLYNWTSRNNVTYFVDSQSGNDSSNGKTPAAAWRTLNKVDTGIFGPGDHILLRSGSAWNGYLAPGGSGSNKAPIVIDRYGAGPKPKIDAKGQYLATLYISNSSYITIKNLDIANQCTVRQPKLTGVKISEMNFGTSKSITLDSLDVHDVDGSDVKADGGGAGISCSVYGATVPTRFDGLVIQGCHLQRTDRDGITMTGAWERENWYPSLHVIIQHNTLEDIGGDGIVPIACDGAVVQYNTLRGGRTRAKDYAAGIWPWSCDNTLVQFNEVSGMVGTNDGEGYDADFNCRNTTIQYNFSHDNQGGFLLICDDGSQSAATNVGNIGTIARYNISVDDGLHTFHIAGPCTKTHVYNNTIYSGDSSADFLISSDGWGGHQQGTTFENNIFATTHKMGFSIDGVQTLTFLNNEFYGNFDPRPSDPAALTTDPLFKNKGGKSAADYTLQKTSPLRNAGKLVPNNGGRDFSGKPVPVGKQPSIGAFQE